MSPDRAGSAVPASARRPSVSEILAVLAALGILPLLILVLRRGVEVPFWDEWEWASYVYAAHTHTLTFAQLWAAHNEHRILIPNLIMLGLDAVGGWSVVREQVVSLVVLAVTQFSLWLLIRQTVRTSLRGACFLIGSVLLLGLAQYENLYWGFQMAWFICNAGLLVAIWALTRRRRTAVDVLVAVVAATVASLSSSQGLVVWPAGLVALLILPRRNAPVVFAWLAVGAILFGIVRFGSPGQSDPGHVGLTQIVPLAQYCLIYLGAPLAASLGIDAASYAGTAFLAWAVALAVAARRSSPRLRVRLAPWAAILAYSVACAIVTALGRAGYGVAQANASRYTSISSLGWIALIAATFVLAKPLHENVRWRYAPVAAVVVASVVQSWAGFGAWKGHQAVMVRARAQLQAGDPAALPLIYPDRARVTLELSELAKIRDGLFSDSGRGS